jgi:glycosyltransferase involved in cell wall biosynthesis
MRILVGSYPAVTILGGGTHTQATSLAQEVSKVGHEAELFDTWRDYQLKDFDWFYLVGAHAGTVHLARATRQLGLRLAVSPVFFSRRSPRMLDWRISWVDFWQGATGLTSEGLFTREVCRLADLVLPNTRAEAELVVHGLGIPAARVRVLPNGCDERFYGANPDAFVREYGKKDFVLYAGHIGLGRKNLLGLIRAMQGIDRPLVIIGKMLENGYGRQCLEEARKLKDSLVIPGLDHGSPMYASALAACDTLCLPALFETPGLAALEAGLAGAKIAITKYGGTTEYFGDHASYLEPGSVESIRQAVQRSLARPRSDELREHIRTNHLWRHAARRLIEILEPMKKNLAADERR